MMRTEERPVEHCSLKQHVCTVIVKIGKKNILSLILTFAARFMGAQSRIFPIYYILGFLRRFVMSELTYYLKSIQRFFIGETH